jgi:hypothetical protein
VKVFTWLLRHFGIKRQKADRSVARSEQNSASPFFLQRLNWPVTPSADRSLSLPVSL